VDAAHLVPLLAQESHEARDRILIVVGYQNAQLLHVDDSRFAALRAMQPRTSGMGGGAT
jgi:hypothetical protein